MSLKFEPKDKIEPQRSACRERLSEKGARDNPERYLGISSIHCRTYFCCFLLALANIRPWHLVRFFHISPKC